MSVETLAQLPGESGNSLLLTEVSKIGAGYCRAVVSVTLDWCQATVPFEASCERFNEFIEALDRLLAEGEGQVNFINEDGNFDLDVDLNRRGAVTLHGVLSESMTDDTCVRYRFNSDRMSLERFSKRLKALFTPER